MDAYRLDLKLYFEAPEVSPREAAIRSFHRFIQQKVLDELLIDVADYGHVPSGPGVMLIGHEAHYALDASDGRPGLLYSRKRALEGSFESRLHHAFGRLLGFAELLEAEAELGIVPRLDLWTLRFNDRLRAPNTAETAARVTPGLERVLSDLFGNSECKVEWEGDASARLGIRVELPAAEPGLSVARLRERLEAPALAIAG